MNRWMIWSRDLGSCDLAGLTIDDDGHVGRIQGTTTSDLNVLGIGEDQLVACGGGGLEGCARHAIKRKTHSYHMITFIHLKSVLTFGNF